MRNVPHVPADVEPVVLAGRAVELDVLDAEGELVAGLGGVAGAVDGDLEGQVLERPEVGLGDALPGGRDEGLGVEQPADPVVQAAEAQGAALGGGSDVLEEEAF